MTTEVRASTPAAWRLWVEAAIAGVAAAVLTLYNYVLLTTRPSAASQGFMGWFDQGQYLSIAKILAAGHIPMGHGEYSYGLGYPLTAVVPIWLGAEFDPFIVPSTILFGCAMAFTLVAARRLIGRAGSWVVVSLLLVASPLLSLTAIPWSSTVTIFALSFALMIATQERVALPWFAVLGVLSAWTFASRFVDVVPVLAVSVVAAFRARNERWWLALVIGGAVTALGVGAVLYTQWKSLGSPFTTPYASHLRPATGTSDQSLAQYRLDRVLPDFWGTFVSGRRDGVRIVDATPLLQVAPYLLLAPLGFVAAMVEGAGRRVLHISAAAATIAISVLYLAFAAGSAGDLLYHNQRYWAPWYPFWTILAVGGAQWALSALVGRRSRRRAGVDAMIGADGTRPVPASEAGGLS